jgi:hypothetical protein
MIDKSRYLTSLLILTILPGCGGDSATQPPADPSIVANIVIKPGRTSLAVGSSVWLDTEVTNAAGAILVGKAITWASSRPDVATVSSDGYVTGVATGATVVTATIEGHSASVALTVQGPNRFELTSDAGDYIGGGRSYTYTNANAILPLVNGSQGIFLRVIGNERWDANFEVPPGQNLAPGSWVNVTRWGGQAPGRPGMSWSGEGRGCNALTGSFTIDSLIWSSGIGSKLVSLDLRFEQHCEDLAPALKGTIHWRDDDRTVPPGPVMPIPTNLWRPPAGATPAEGDFVFLESDPGDSVGHGTTTLIQGTMEITQLHRQMVVIQVGGSLGFDGWFGVMNSIPQFQEGYYGGLMRWAFSNPTVGGIDVGYNDRYCNKITGWFVIDRVYYALGVLAGIELRFEQHCEAIIPALRGAVRWGRFAG